MRRALLCGLASALILSGTACTSDRTEVVIGIATDLSAPDALDQVKLEVYRDGVPIIDLPPWDIPGTAGGDYVLPASFGVYADDGSEPSIDVRVHGMKAGGVIVTRRALFSLVHGKTLFFRMGLVARCVSASDCPGVDQTCVEGVCRSAQADARTFLAYIPGMENTVACSSGTTFTDTGTGMPLGGADSGGAAGCAPDEVCQEGTCYKVPSSGGGLDAGADLGLTGQFLMAVMPDGADSPLELLASVTQTSPTTLDISLQPLWIFCQGPGPDQSLTPVGPALQATNVPIENNTFVLNLPGVMIDERADPLRCAGFTADLSISATIQGPDSFCGMVDGEITSPQLSSLVGTTFGAIRVPFGTIGDALPAPVISCSDASDGGAGSPLAP